MTVTLNTCEPRCQFPGEHRGLLHQYTVKMAANPDGSEVKDAPKESAVICEGHYPDKSDPTFSQCRCELCLWREERAAVRKNSMSPALVSLLGMAGALAPDIPPQRMVGHQCKECGQSIGHSVSCSLILSDRFVAHCRDHPACRKVIQRVIETQNSDGLCPRGKRLFEKLKPSPRS